MQYFDTVTSENITLLVFTNEILFDLTYNILSKQILHLFHMFLMVLRHLDCFLRIIINMYITFNLSHYVYIQKVIM
jgi:hypothetical protein